MRVDRESNKEQNRTEPWMRAERPVVDLVLMAFRLSAFSSIRNVVSFFPRELGE